MRGVSKRKQPPPSRGEQEAESEVASPATNPLSRQEPQRGSVSDATGVELEAIIARIGCNTQNFLSNWVPAGNWSDYRTSPPPRQASSSSHPWPRTPDQNRFVRPGNGPERPLRRSWAGHGHGILVPLPATRRRELRWRLRRPLNTCPRRAYRVPACSKYTNNTHSATCGIAPCVLRLQPGPVPDYGVGEAAQGERGSC